MQRTAIDLRIVSTDSQLLLIRMTVSPSRDNRAPPVWAIRQRNVVNTYRVWDLAALRVSWTFRKVLQNGPRPIAKLRPTRKWNGNGIRRSNQFWPNITLMWLEDCCWISSRDASAILSIVRSFTPGMELVFEDHYINYSIINWFMFTSRTFPTRSTSIWWKTLEPSSPRIDHRCSSSSSRSCP